MQLPRRELLSSIVAASLLFSVSLVRADWNDHYKENLFPISERGKWGYINATGKVVIAPHFEEAAYFSEGLARVKIGGKYGFINDRGEMIISPTYNLVWDFREGLAYVEDNPAKFIDRAGTTALFTPDSHRFLEFHNGLGQGRPYMGLPRLSPHYPQTYGWINKTGQWAIKPRFIEAWDFTEGLAAVTLENNKAGFIDTSGKWVIQPRFDEATYFSDGLAQVVEAGQHFFINKKGGRAFAGNYEDATLFHDGLAAIEVGKKWGFIDRNGQVVVEPTLEEVDTFFNGRAAFRSNGKWGYINKKGTVVIPAIYAYTGSFWGDLAPVSLAPDHSDGSGRSYINREGKVIWAPVKQTL